METNNLFSGPPPTRVAGPDSVSLVSRVIGLIQRGRFDLSSEKSLQEGIASVLSVAGVPFEREHRLAPGDIPDFFVEGGIVIECKMHGKSRKMEVFRQLSRYAAHADVTAIVLASNMSIGLPPDIAGKPLYSASISRGWL